jgi:CDP-diacylglycerol pyrophosphatase
MRRRSALLATIAMLAGLAGSVARAADPDALWKIVTNACVPHELDGSGGRPCALVDIVHGYTVLKDLVGRTQFLMIPIARLGGIESPQLLAPGAPPYWADAWAARVFVSARAGRTLPDDDIGLAINAVSGRSQNQFHIHIDCIRPDVRAVLRDEQTLIGEAWSPLRVPFDGHTYLARRIAQPTLDAVDPFRLLADGVPAARADMAHATLVLTVSATPSGHDDFILLADQANAVTGDRGNGEELLDHACTLAHVD